MAKSPKATAETDSARMRGWSSQKKLAVAVTGGVIAVLGGWGTIKDEVVTPVASWVQGLQPRHDERILNELRTGVQLAQFTSVIGAEPVARYFDDVEFRGGGRSVLAHGEVYQLDTVTIVAFSDEQGRVLGYSVVGQSQIHPQNIRAGLYDVDFGEEMQPPVKATGLDYLAGDCGAHTGSYYEVYTAPNAVGAQTLALGVTDAGVIPEDMIGSPCIDPILRTIPLTDEASRNNQTVEYVVSLYTLPQRSTALMDVLRRKVNINFFAITDAGYAMPSEMMSLHPDRLQRLLAPKQ